MEGMMRVILVGNSLPRLCGISTFTTELCGAVAQADAHVSTGIVAMTDTGAIYDYPPNVVIDVRERQREDYTAAADLLNRSNVDVVCLQHEFGIFGGPSGDYILELLGALQAPLVTTFHTVRAVPSTDQRQVIQAIAGLSTTVVVMSRHGQNLLHDVYDVAEHKIELVPHGVPDEAFRDPDVAKAKLGFANRSVILTFGLLSPGKGIETIVDAMPEVIRQCPEAIYVVLGATHPHLLRDQGDAYRNMLIERVEAANLGRFVVFRDQFVDRDILLDFIAMCDVYVTPYLDLEQTTSGTLAYSYSMGKAIVSTAYGHAAELLANGCGVLLRPGDVSGFAREIGALLTDHDRRNTMRRQAYADSRSMIWPSVGQRYLKVFKKAIQPKVDLDPLGSVIQIRDHQAPAKTIMPPTISTDHLLSMCDDTGLLQHAVRSVANRVHGYCVDDNARALLLACALSKPGENGLPALLVARLTAFIQHAWNPDLKRFRNFMDFQRCWLEDRGSEDSHGRALWALGVCAGVNGCRREWAADLFRLALPAVTRFRSPRAWSFALLGLDGFCFARGSDRDAIDMRDILTRRLMALFAAVEHDGWVWFETGLAYDNARLSQALIVTGKATGNQDVTDAGLRSLRWLMGKQTADEGWFRPFGTEGFGKREAKFQHFDQQPIEAAASVSACLAAFEADQNPVWRDYSWQAFNWFLGMNDLGVALADNDTGACRDGLHRDRANENRGAESTLSYLLALAEVRQLVHRDDGLDDFKAEQLSWSRP